MIGLKTKLKKVGINNADFIMIAESPNTAAEVWIQRAQQVPKAVLRPPNFPTDSTEWCSS